MEQEELLRLVVEVKLQRHSFCWIFLCAGCGASVSATDGVFFFWGLMGLQRNVTWIKKCDVDKEMLMKVLL